MKASARFVKGSGRVYISGYDATRGEGVALEKNNLVTFRPDATGQAVIEFTVSSRYGLPVKENVTIQVNQGGYEKNCRIIALFVPGGRVKGTIYRKPVYEREAGLYRG